MQGHRHALLASVLIMLAAGCESEDVVSAAVTPPSCAEITDFAEQIVDVGITYDYDPSESPAELASDADVVVGGVLTGGFDDGHADGLAYVSYEIEITDVVKGADSLVEGDTTYVSVDYNPTSVESQEFEEAIAVGAPVVVFGNSTDDSRELVASIEGFMTACDNAEPIGWRGTAGAWSKVDSLDEVLKFADDASISKSAAAA